MLKRNRSFLALQARGTTSYASLSILIKWVIEYMASLEVNRKAFSVGDLNDNTKEKRYGLSCTTAKRLEAIETNRRIVYGYFDTPSRLLMGLGIVDLADLDRLS